MIERAVLLAEPGSAIDLPHLFKGEGTAFRTSMMLGANGEVRDSPSADGWSRLATNAIDLIKQRRSGLAELQDEIVRAAVEAADGNIAQAARDLGLSRRQLAFRLEKIGRVQ